MVSNEKMGASDIFYRALFLLFAVTFNSISSLSNSSVVTSKNRATLRTSSTVGSFRPNSTMEKPNHCEICGAELKGRQRRFCSPNCKNRALQSYHAQQERGVHRKIEIVRNMGGKCSRCGYSGNLSAFHFHHLDPSKKNFRLDLRAISNRKIEAVQLEVDKCILLCANCHAETHNPRLNMGALLKKFAKR